LSAANDLEAAGVDLTQAENIAKKMGEIGRPDLDWLVTKADLFRALLVLSLGTIAVTAGLVTQTRRA